MPNHLTARYGLIHGAYWASYAAIAAYVNLYLLESILLHQMICFITMLHLINAMLEDVLLESHLQQESMVNGQDWKQVILRNSLFRLFFLSNRA